eukprot:1190430-Prorocentrum_minimum.AAC.1
MGGGGGYRRCGRTCSLSSAGVALKKESSGCDVAAGVVAAGVNTCVLRFEGPNSASGVGAAVPDGRVLDG